MTRDELIEQVARAIEQSLCTARIHPTTEHPWSQEARAAIDVVLEAAAKVCDERADELVKQRESAPLGDGYLNWSYFNWLVGEAEDRAAAIRAMKSR